MDILEEKVFEAIYKRRSIRRYLDRPVEREKIDKLLKAAMAAPSACNLQPYEFIVVTEPDLLAKVKATAQGSEYSAPMAVVVCADTSNVPWDGDGWMIDCSAAIENMLVAAAAMGLGSVWIGSADEAKVRALLDIPERTHVLNMVYFGYPDEPKKSRTQYDESAVYWQKYEPGRKRQLRTMEMLRDPASQE